MSSAALSHSAAFFVSDGRYDVVVEFEKLAADTSWKTLSPAWPVGVFSEPAGIALIDDGRLVVVDRGHHRLVVFSADRATTNVLAPDGDPIGSLWQPTGVALGADGSIFVADTGNHRIVRCASIDAPTWSAFGSAGTGAFQFMLPTGIACDSKGRIVIADPRAARVIRMDSMTGSNWSVMSLPPSAETAGPYGVAAGLDGILIADASTSRVLLLSDKIVGPDNVTTLIDGTAGTLLAPIAAIALSGALYVADVGGASIARFVTDASGAWILDARLSGERGPFPSPVFPRIGGFTAGPNP